VGVSKFGRSDGLDISGMLEDRIENGIFEAKLRFTKTYYTGYSNYVFFETEKGLLLLMQNRGVLKLLQMLCEKKLDVDSNGFIATKFKFSKSTYRYYIYPVK